MKILKMAKRFSLVALTGVTILALSACSSTQTTGEEISDAAVTTKVKAKLVADPEINPFKIDVDTNEGVVRLSGTVHEQSQREEAEKLASRTEGVTKVINDVKIGEGSMGQRFDDAGIASRVKARLAADPEINPFNVNVDSEDGVVTLMGRVKDRDHRDEVVRLARDTEGVKDVVDRLEIGKRDSD